MNSQKNCIQTKTLWVGIGCKRQTTKQQIESAITHILATHNLTIETIAGIATIESKAKEIGLLELCQKYHWKLKTFPPEQLKNISVPNPSNITESIIGIPSVCEAAAILAAFNHTQNQPYLQIQKQKYRPQKEAGAITIAIAKTN